MQSRHHRKHPQRNYTPHSQISPSKTNHPSLTKTPPQHLTRHYPESLSHNSQARSNSVSLIQSSALQRSRSNGAQWTITPLAIYFSSGSICSAKHRVLRIVIRSRGERLSGLSIARVMIFCLILCRDRLITKWCGFRRGRVGYLCGCLIRML